MDTLATKTKEEIESLLVKTTRTYLLDPTSDNLHEVLNVVWEWKTLPDTGNKFYLYKSAGSSGIEISKIGTATVTMYSGVGAKKTTQCKTAAQALKTYSKFLENLGM